MLLWLRLGLYQLRELRVPDHAAVYETVERTRRDAPRAAGLVNAVLRAAAREGPSPHLYPDPEADPLGWLSTWGSHPEWLLGRWLARWPAGDVRALVELDNRPPDVVLRLLGPGGCEEMATGSSGSGADGASEGSDPEGARLEPLPPWPRSCRLAAGDPERLLGRTPAVVQDPAASAVVDYAGPPRAPVLDACAAPGGKAAVLAAGAREARPYVAADLSAERLGRVVEAERRLDLGLACVVMDARRPAVRRAATVLLDAPCTGTGVLRRRPDARWRLGPERLESLVGLQRELLDACAAALAPGGLLVYATCSLEPEENERQVDEFLERHVGFRREPPPADVPLPEDVVDGRGDLVVLPWLHGTDGSYAARLRRAA